jgi:hypothetical protein
MEQLAWTLRHHIGEGWMGRGYHLDLPTGLLTVDCYIKVRMDLQADKSPVIVKRPFLP